MANMQAVLKELRLAGFKNNYWGISAIRQLPTILEADEHVERVVTGVYEGGHAVLVATNKRMIFLDKKVMSFKVEEIHYEMISEVEHFVGIFMAKLRVHCLAKKVEIGSLSIKSVRDFAQFVDAKVNKIRLNLMTWQEMMGEHRGSVPVQSPQNAGNAMPIPNATMLQGRYYK